MQAGAWRKSTGADSDLPHNTGAYLHVKDFDVRARLITAARLDCNAILRRQRARQERHKKA